MAAIGGSPLANPLFAVLNFAIGTAVGPALRPGIEDIVNAAWETHPVRPLDVHDLAQLVARSIPFPFDAGRMASQTGHDTDPFQALIQLARQYPGLPEMLHLWRRREADPGDVKGWLNRHGFSDTVAAQLMLLKDEWLDPAVIAVMVQRGIMANPGWLPVGPPSGVGKVPPMPMIGLDPAVEAAGSGYDEERMAGLTRIVGLPASPDLAARMTFRNIIERVDFDRAIAEGNTRNEWADALFEGFRQILTPNQYTELELRGYIDAAQRRAFTDQSGMSHADSDRLLQVLGRSVTPHQVVTALARGGKYPGNYDNVPQPYKASIQRSNIREEYAELAYANRYTYPSFFAIRGLLTGGVLSADEGYQILLEMGWKPSLARTVADFYGVSTTVKDGPLTKSARTQAVTEIRQAFLIGQADEGQARGWLGAIGVSATETDGMLPIWKVMLEVPQKGLTAAQIVKAFKKLPAQWPRARALDELQLLGLTADDAATLLDE